MYLLFELQLYNGKWCAYKSYYATTIHLEEGTCTDFNLFLFYFTPKKYLYQEKEQYFIVLIHSLILSLSLFFLMISQLELLYFLMIKNYHLVEKDRKVDMCK